MRDGERWFYEASNIFSQFIDVSTVNYCGFDRVILGNKVHNAGVFEFPREFKFTEDIINYLQNYDSELIFCMRVYTKITRYKNCVLVVLR